MKKYKNCVYDPHIIFYISISQRLLFFANMYIIHDSIIFINDSEKQKYWIKQVINSINP